MKKYVAMVYFFVILIAGVVSGGCRGVADATGNASVSGDTLTCEAELLTLIDCGDYLIAEIDNPWAEGQLARYVLAPTDYKGELPEGTRIETPLNRSVVFSGVYGGAIAELGRTDAISGVADAKYFVLPELAEAITAGRIADVGNAMSPSVEAIVDCEPGTIIASPYQGQEQGAIERLGIPIVAMVDYMESTPLGRAEWIKLLGALYGKRAEADSIFRLVTGEYHRLAALAGESPSRPVVITEQPHLSGQWDLPSGGSYMARMLADAGADYPWADTSGAGSLKSDVAAVYDRARGADYWLIRSYGPLTATDLGQISPLVADFKAIQTGGLYVCDTSRSPLFDEFPFHPELLLADYVRIFHPEAMAQNNELRYFKNVVK